MDPGTEPMTDAIASVLSQIRAMEGQVGGVRAPQPMREVVSPGGVQQPGFAETLKRMVGTVNESQLEAGRLREAFEHGDPSVDLVRVMIASQQSQVAFRATVEVRNRLVQAYQDVMNMPI